jgi:hypothetical protein
MTNKYRKIFFSGNINLQPQIIDERDNYTPASKPPIPLPLPPSGASGLPVEPPTFSPASVAGESVFDKPESDDSHTVMVGGIPCVFRRGYGDI